ncbi:hypothetical protein HUT06_25825 [Actinomadura sp. NAK00032]|uniref:hypothetical protein n=1 Tax=Actinomadura sp. NAK00032 TaxID=2742128 RepID=UPI00158FB010|nr:hypothetical protein [Actinomadura sp. NAK00032]QKW37009.1 hypothetical protein HUT06_25825 [Actinomadura sp. NAK00032]
MPRIGVRRSVAVDMGASALTTPQMLADTFSAASGFRCLNRFVAAYCPVRPGRRLAIGTTQARSTRPAWSCTSGSFTGRRFRHMKPTAPETATAAYEPYSGILDEIAAAGHDVLTARARVPCHRRAAIFARHMLAAFAAGRAERRQPAGVRC